MYLGESPAPTTTTALTCMPCNAQKHTSPKTPKHQASLARAVREPGVKDLGGLPVVVPPQALQGSHAGAVLAGGQLPMKVLLQSRRSSVPVRE